MDGFSITLTNIFNVNQDIIKIYDNENIKFF